MLILVVCNNYWSYNFTDYLIDKKILRVVSIQLIEFCPTTLYHVNSFKDDQNKICYGAIICDVQSLQNCIKSTRFKFMNSEAYALI